MGVWNRTSKEVMRHLLGFTGADFLLDSLRRHRGIFNRLPPGRAIRAVREDLCNGKLVEGGTTSWRPGRSKLRVRIVTAGDGQTFGQNDPTCFNTSGPKRLVDIGCGDFTGMRTHDLAIPYCGVDIVANVIAANQVRHALPYRSFICLDASKDDLPVGDTGSAAEIIFHLSFAADIRRMLENIAKKDTWWASSAASNTVARSISLFGSQTGHLCCRLPG